MRDRIQSWRAPAPTHTSISSLPYGCLGLRNVASFHTIVSALQSPATKRLKDTWGQVSRWVGCSPSKHHEGEVDPAPSIGSPWPPQSAEITWETVNAWDTD